MLLNGFYKRIRRTLGKISKDERIEQFISAVKYLKEERPNELPDASPNWATPLGFVSVKAFWGPVKDYHGGFEVFWDDGLMIYQSFENDGLLCEGTSLSTGVTFSELTHFEDMEALQEHLNKAN